MQKCKHCDRNIYDLNAGVSRRLQKVWYHEHTGLVYCRYLPSDQNNDRAEPACQ